MLPQTDAVRGLLVLLRETDALQVPQALLLVPPQRTLQTKKPGLAPWVMSLELVLQKETLGLELGPDPVQRDGLQAQNERLDTFVPPQDCALDRRRRVARCERWKTRHH